jgi:hypothetical protein
MDYMILIVDRKEAPAGETVGMAEMGQFAGELARKGKMRGGAPLHAESTATRVSVRGGRARSVDGPFAESKEVVGGFFMVDADSRAEAIEIAKRCPAARSSVVQVNEAIAERIPAPPTGGSRYMLLFLEGPDFEGDPDGAKYREMERWTGELKDEKKYVECAGLAKSPPPVRIEVRAGKTAVSDGPFAESKEVIGGYALVDVPDRGEALAIARRCPHATWGEVEVREVMKIGPM